ncbi:hypothetical protein NE865_11006 [Phthorimaea operculella]|nr:hypothetical protein NE865_11006 [Phthorimaea operculella]
MFAKKALLFVSSVILVCDSAFVNNLKRCQLDDWDCQKDTFQQVLRDIGKTGIPEVGIPPIDPFPVKNVTVSVLNMIDITMVDGVAKGVKDCIVNKLETDLDNERATMEMTCDITVKGEYKVFGDAPIIKNLLGGSTVHGEGFGKVRLEKFNMRFDYHILVRNVNGENYIQCQYKDLRYTYSLGKATFAANNLYIGETEASGVILTMLNDNWKFIMDTFGKPFLDKAMDIAYEQSHKFFDVTPAKYYLLDDLTPYVQTDE